ncbi:MAG TPA: LytTR family DNA-binding domain-containing protein [Gemmatimonadaceae bacterium]|nr:LytTR family DNA-binding domain-containing protein [Gemmatimonadaceae bacterium]
MRVLIVDDESHARQRLRRLLGEAEAVEVVGEAGNGREAISAIEALAPDLVLLDVQMPNLDGFDVVRALPEKTPLIIFVTAFDQHAVRAFEVHALDYLLKPVEPERFAEAIERARAQLVQSSAAERHARLMAFLETGAAEPAPAAMLPRREPEPGTTRDSLDRLLVKDGGTMYFVLTADIDWVEAYGNYVRIHTGTKTHLLRKTLGALEGMLDPHKFVRIHRSTIVNLDRVSQMELWGSGDYIVRLATGAKLKLSRWYRDRIESHMRP